MDQNGVFWPGEALDTPDTTCTWPPLAPGLACLRKPPKAPLHLLSHAHAHTCTSHGMHGMAAHLNRAVHRRSALRRAAIRGVSPALPRARLLLASARLLLARDRYQFAGLYGTTCAVHVLCSACASEGERALVVSRPGPASSVFAHANTGGMAVTTSRTACEPKP